MAIATQTILDGDRLAIFKFTNDSGTVETAALKVDVATLKRNGAGLPCTGVKINKIWSGTHGMEVQILWDATTDVLAWGLTQNSTYLMDFSSFGGIPNDAGAGKTGNVLFTTLDATAGDFYAITIEFLKTYG